MTKIKSSNGIARKAEMPTDKKQIARQFMEMVVAGKIDEAYSKFVSANGKHHNVYFREGFPALQQAMKENHLQFPNKELTIQHVIGDDDLVAVHAHIVVKLGEAGIMSILMFRFQGNKIVELWDIDETIPDNSPNQDGAF